MRNNVERIAPFSFFKKGELGLCDEGLIWAKRWGSRAVWTN